MEEFKFTVKGILDVKWFLVNEKFYDIFFRVVIVIVILRYMFFYMMLLSNYAVKFCSNDFL